MPLTEVGKTLREAEPSEASLGPIKLRPTDFQEDMGREVYSEGINLRVISI